MPLLPASIPPSIHPFGLLLTADARREGWGHALQGAARRGSLRRVRPGVYCDAASWDRMTAEQRGLARVRAASLTFVDPVFSHQSAALIHGLPLFGEQTRVHVLARTETASGTRIDTTVHRPSGDPDMVVRSGLRATSPAKTVLDLARTLPHAHALALADAALRPASVATGLRGTGAAQCTRDDLRAAAHVQVRLPRGWTAFLIAEAADPLSGSAGESAARSVFLRLGAPTPELQVPFFDRDGLIGYADFFWREFGVIGEFDGKLKYGADNPAGARPETVVYREKLREDRLRRVSRGFVRFAWRDVMQPERAARLLQDAGIPLDRRAAWPRTSRAVASAEHEGGRAVDPVR